MKIPFIFESGNVRVAHLDLTRKTEAKMQAPTRLPAKSARAIRGPEFVAQPVQLLLRRGLGRRPRRWWPPRLGQVMQSGA